MSLIVRHAQQAGIEHRVSDEHKEHDQRGQREDKTRMRSHGLGSGISGRSGPLNEPDPLLQDGYFSRAWISSLASSIAFWAVWSPSRMRWMPSKYAWTIFTQFLC